MLLKQFPSKIIKSNLSEKDAYKLEEVMISRIGINNLTNMAVYTSPNSGYFHSEESKQRMSLSKKGRTPWNKGMKFPEMSEKRKGSGNPRFGLKTVHSEETKRKMRLRFGTICCDLLTGIFFESVEEACRNYKVSRKKIFKKVTIV